MAFVQRADAQSLDALMRSITALFATDSEEQPAQQKETYPTAEKLKGIVKIIADNQYGGFVRWHCGKQHCHRRPGKRIV